jgi:hypothetical protein
MGHTGFIVLSLALVLLVAYGREKYGIDVLENVTRDAALSGVIVSLSRHKEIRRGKFCYLQK